MNYSKSSSNVIGFANSVASLVLAAIHWYGVCVSSIYLNGYSSYMYVWSG